MMPYMDVSPDRFDQIVRATDAGPIEVDHTDQHYVCKVGAFTYRTPFGDAVTTHFADALQVVEDTYTGLLTMEGLVWLLERISQLCPAHDRCSVCQAHHCEACNVGVDDVVVCDETGAPHCTTCVAECGPCRVAVRADTYVRPGK